MSSYSDSASFEALYRSTGLRLYAYARRQGDADLARDVVSETFLIAWRRRDELPEDVLPWLFVTARNVLFAHWRSRTKHERLTGELEGLAHLTELSDADEDERLVLLAAFARLSESDREILLLIGWDGLSAAQAASLLGCSANTFSARLSRARRRLDALTVEAPTNTPFDLQTIGELP